MLKLASFINRFTFGEVSPLLSARGDLAKYGSACRTLVNFIPLLQGPVQRRGGTRFIARADNGVNPVALLDFAYSETTTYVLEVGNRYMRFYCQGAPVMNGSQPYQITTPWRQEDLFLANGICTLKWVQSGDVMYIVCPGQPPQKLSRYGHTNWRVEALPGWNTSAKTRPNASAVALFRERLCLGSGQIVYMSQSGAFENFEPGQRGLMEATVTSSHPVSWPMTVNSEEGTVTITNTGNSARYIIVSFLPGEVDLEQKNSAMVVVRPKVSVDRITRIGFTPSATGCAVTPSSVAGTIRGKWSDSSNVTMVSFDPVKGAISSDASFDNGYIITSADVAVAADDPLEISVYSEQMDKIEWLCPSSGLLVGTTGGEFLISETTTVDPLGPENVKVVPETAFGSSAIQALRIGSVIIFVQRSGRKVREFVYDYAGDNYQALDLTVAAEHITAGGLTTLAWQSEPTETLWAVRPDGQLIGFTYCKDQDMTAWHRHQLGGGGQVSQLAVIPAAHGGRDELWLSVRRIIDNKVVYCLERLEEGHEFGRARAEAFFVDCGLSISGPGLTEINGLEHLEGCEAAILADGGVQPPQVVRSGRITLQYPADLVQVGLPFESRLTTVNLDAQLQDGTAQARRKRLIRITFRLVESGGGSAGTSPRLHRAAAVEGGAGSDEVLRCLDYLEFRRGHDLTDQAPALFTGDKTMVWPGGWETDGAITVVQVDPLPLTLAGIIAEVNIDSLN